MSRRTAPRGGLPSGLGAPLALLAVVWLTVAAAGLVKVAGSVASWMTGHHWTAPDLDLIFIRRLLAGGPAALWPTTPPSAVWAVLLAFLLAAAAAVAVVMWKLTRSRGGRALLSMLDVGDTGETPASIARLTDVAALTPAATTVRARVLRPSLADVPVKSLADADLGIVLGVLGPPRRGSQVGSVRSISRGQRGRVLRASWEDVLLAVMAPRAGKTTALAIPTVLAAPGPVVATSNKADLWAATAALRARDTGERVWVFDPQQITGAPRTWWWNPLAGCATVEEAARLAGHFIGEVRSERGERDFWTSAAHDLLTSLLLAAATSGRTLVDVYAWLNDPTIPTPATLLREGGHEAAAAALTGRQHGAPETRDGVYETARTAAACLRDPAILAWVTPSHIGSRSTPAASAQLDVQDFATSRQSLYLLSKDGAGAAAPLVAALTDRVMREGVRAAERSAGGLGGRLDPPMIAVLDEAANVCKIADLPDLYSHLGSRGIVPLTILQSYRQGVRVWGEPGMDTLWSAATIKLLGAGLDDARLAEDVSRLVGDHDVTVHSYSDGERRRSTSTSLRRQRILPPEDLRALPRGTALLLATGTRAALITLLPTYTGPRRDEVADATRTAHADVAAHRRGDGRTAGLPGRRATATTRRGQS